MKNAKCKKLLLLAVIMIVVTAGSSLLTVMINGKNDTEDKQTITIATSFYPTYIAALNVTKGMDNVKVVNLMGQQQGCLHDYQLTTDNMRTLEGADALIINGAGMEAFLDDIKTNYKKLDIIDSSEGISLLTITGEVHDHDHEDADHEDADHDHEDADHKEEADHDHEEADHEEADHEEADHEDEDHDHEDTDHEEEHDHDHGDYNAHIWLDPERYIEQINNIAEGLSKLDEENKGIYLRNAKAYEDKVKVLENEFKELKAFDYNKVILFHNSMEYLCNRLGIEVPFSLNVDGETSLSAGEVAMVIDEVKENDIKVLFSEKQYESSIADRISKETGAKVYVLDSLVTGDDNLDSYLDGMRSNLNILKQALYK